MSFRDAMIQLLEFIVKTLLGSVIIGALIFSVIHLGPVVERSYFPVVSKLRIIELTPEPRTGHARVMAEFTKFRDCEYIGIAWYRGTPAIGFERVPVILQRQVGDNSSPNRPIGTQRSGPWIIGMPIHEIDGNSFAQLFHRCHPFWLSRTDFYP